MKSKIFLAGLLILAVLFSNVLSIIMTYSLATKPVKECTVTPPDVSMASPNPSITQTVTPIISDDNEKNESGEKPTLTEVSSSNNSKTYQFSAYTIVIPNSYSIILEDGNSIQIKPKIKKFTTHNNSIRISSLADPITFGYMEPWEPSLDSEVTINGVKYNKTASIFGEGGEMEDNIRNWLDGSITYHTFYDGFLIQEFIGASIENYDETKYPDTFRDFVLSSDGKELVDEMDDILKTLKPLAN